MTRYRLDAGNAGEETIVALSDARAMACAERLAQRLLRQYRSEGERRIDVAVYRGAVRIGLATAEAR